MVKARSYQVLMDTAVERWDALINARAQQMDAAYACLGRTSADYWDRRASSFHRWTKESTATDPLFLKILHEITPQTTILDVGAGTGRFTLALAPLVQHVTAVEPNASMLDYLRRDAKQEGLTNISSVPTTWQDAPSDLSADIVICSHVLCPIQDIVPFLAKLQAATRSCLRKNARIPSREIVPTGQIFSLTSPRIGSPNPRCPLLSPPFLIPAPGRWTGKISREADFFGAGSLLVCLEDHLRV